jgi:hypothetical protein
VSTINFFSRYFSKAAPTGQRAVYTCRVSGDLLAARFSGFTLFRGGCYNRAAAVSD